MKTILTKHIRIVFIVTSSILLIGGPLNSCTGDWSKCECCVNCTTGTGLIQPRTFHFVLKIPPIEQEAMNILPCFATVLGRCFVDLSWGAGILAPLMWWGDVLRWVNLLYVIRHSGNAANNCPLSCQTFNILQLDIKFSVLFWNIAHLAFWTPQHSLNYQ